MPEKKTIGQLMEEMRLKAGAREYSGHSYMDLNRFAEDTRHMIIFDTLTADSPVGWKGERSRAFLTEEGYKKSLERQEQGHIRIVSHAKVRNGHLHYDRAELKRCTECGGQFLPKSNRGKYCPDCAGRMKRARAAQRKRKQRGKCHALENTEPP